MSQDIWETPSELEALKQSERVLVDVDENDKLASLSNQHEEISRKSRAMVTKALWAMFSFGVTYSMRSNLVILYAETFYKKTSVISIMIYSSYISSAISCIGYGIVGDQWRIDYLMIIASIFDVITFWLEATASGFIVLAICYSIGGQPFSVIGYSFNLKLLPSYHAQQIRGKMLQVMATAEILGPILGGIISYFYSYRTVFYCSAIISVCLLVYTSIVFSNVEKKILNEQLTMKQVYTSDDIDMYKHKYNYNLRMIDKMEDKFKWIISNDYRFPVCLETNKVGSLSAIRRYKGVILILFIIYGALITSIDITIVSFYTTYMKARFDSNIMISTGELSIYTLAYLIGNQVARELAKMMQLKKIANVDYDIRYDFSNAIILVCFICLLIMLICSGIMLPLDIFDFGNDSVAMIIEYWIVIFIYGICVGMGYLSIELVCVQLIPHDVAGKITAIQIVTRMTMGGGMCLIIGMLFDTSVNYLWYTQTLCQVIALCILILVASLETTQWYHHL